MPDLKLLTTRPIMDMGFAYFPDPYRVSLSKTKRQRYRRGSMRLRAMGSREKTSVRIGRMYEREDPFAIDDPSLHWEGIGEVKTGKTRSSTKAREIIFHHHDKDLSELFEAPGIEYFPNVSHFLAEYPDMRILAMTSPMDAQVTVIHWDDKVRKKNIVENLVIVDGLPIKLMEQE